MRVPGWEVEFYKELCAVQSGERPHKYGTNDCALFAARIIRICTGVDYVSDLIKSYSTETGAAKIIKKYGTLEDTVTALLGSKPTSALLARRGDPVLYVDDGRQYVGVADGALAVFLSPGGCRTVPLSACSVGWLT